MCHCHFLYDSIYYPSLNINRLLKQRRRSYKRRKSSTISLSSSMNIDENFCPYTRKVLSNNDDKNEGQTKTKFEIGCPMETNCADVRIVNEMLLKLKIKNINKYKYFILFSNILFYSIRNILICGNDNDVQHCIQIVSVS